MSTLETLKQGTNTTHVQMKFNLSVFNSIGFTNSAQQLWYLANILESALTSSPKITVQAAVTAIIGKRAVPAYAGFTAVPAKTAAQNTTGYTAGAIFPGRPAVAAVPASDGYAAVAAVPALPPNPVFAAGVAVPAYPAVPARLEQVLVLPRAASPAIDLPAIVAIPGYENAVICTATTDTCTVTAYLPCSESPKLVGKSIKNVENLLELTASTVVANSWFDTKASTTPTTTTINYKTIEQALFTLGNQLAISEPSQVIKTFEYAVFGGKTVPCHKFVFELPADSYNPDAESIQLEKLGSVVIPS